MCSIRVSGWFGHNGLWSCDKQLCDGGLCYLRRLVVLFALIKASWSERSYDEIIGGLLLLFSCVFAKNAAKINKRMHDKYISGLEIRHVTWPRYIKHRLLLYDKYNWRRSTNKSVILPLERQRWMKLRINILRVGLYQRHVTEIINAGVRSERMKWIASELQADCHSNRRWNLWRASLSGVSLSPSVTRCVAS